MLSHTQFSLSLSLWKGQVGLLEVFDYIRSNQNRKAEPPRYHNPESRISHAVPFRTWPPHPAVWGRGRAARSVPGPASKRSPMPYFSLCHFSWAFSPVSTGFILILKTPEGLPWWRSGWESACQCRGRGFKPSSGKIPHAAERLGPWATIAEPARLEPVLRNKRGRDSERPAHRDEERPPLAATAMNRLKTKNKKKTPDILLTVFSS